MGLRVWSRREFLSKKINKKPGSIKPPIKTKFRTTMFLRYLEWKENKTFRWIFVCEGKLRIFSSSTLGWRNNIGIKVLGKDVFLISLPFTVSHRGIMGMG